MKSKLRAVDPKVAEPSKPKILIYGKPGVGKTWASLDFPSVYYIDTEGGANLKHYIEKLKRSGGVYFGPEHGSQSFEDVLTEIKTLSTEKHSYRTLVIDSTSKVFNSEIANEMDRLGDADNYGASKKSAVSYIRRLVSWIDRLDMTVILICHEKSEWGLNAKKERVEVGNTFDCWDKLEYELHLCLRIVKQGASRIAHVRKSRLIGFPDTTTFPWSYEEFAERFGKDIIEKEATPIELATDEQLAEIKRLLGIVKLGDTTQDKWISVNADNMNEVEAEKVTNIINYLKGKTA